MCNVFFNIHTICDRSILNILYLSVRNYQSTFPTRQRIVTARAARSLSGYGTLASWFGASKRGPLVGAFGGDSAEFHLDVVGSHYTTHTYIYMYIYLCIM